ncbi:MAG: ABC transporter ATP-binding protein [Anaerolineae bacterium]
MPKSQGHPLLRFWRYARHERRRMIIAILMSVFNKIFDLAPPVLIGAAIDVVIQQGNSVFARLGVEDLSQQLYLLAVLTIVVWGFESIFDYLAQVQWRNLAQSIEHAMRIEAYDHVQSLEMVYFEDRSTGGLMSILNDDINQLERFLDKGADQMIQTATTVLVVGGLFIYIAPQIAWLTILPMPFIIWGSVWFQGLIGPRYSEVRERVGLLNGLLSNNLSGIATIKSYTAEKYETERIRQESGEYLMSNRRAIRLSAAFIPLVRMLILLGFIGILVAGGERVLAGTLDVAAYSVMIFMTQRLLWPLTELGEVLDLYQRAMASTARILNLLDTQPRITEGHEEITNVRGSIRFEDVDFSYTPGMPVLKDLTLDIPAGQTIGIVGTTGSGKSTLVKLLLRFYDVQGGRVTLDGRDIRDLTFDSLRHAIGYVSQDIFLFHGTVKENIAYGTFDATDEEIIAAATVAEAHDFIMSLPNGYDTIVGERGQKLSGGQRQRISLARAVLKDPPVLILDEATASVDNETEAAILRSMDSITLNRTTIVIAHRLSTVQNADKIYVLEHGEIQEAGTHDELLRHEGIYRNLWRGVNLAPLD